MDLATVLITFREGLEAALIVGIILGFLKRIGRGDRAMVAWAGIAAALLLSGAIAVVMAGVGATLQEPYEQMFEGTTMLLAVAILTWMVFWMRSQARFMRHDLEARLAKSVEGGERFGLFALVFLAVFREGVETALFLAANAFATGGSVVWVGASVGIVLSAVAGIAIYRLAVRLNLKLFFEVTSLFLILFAAGLLAHAIHEYQEIGWLTVWTGLAWDTAGVLSNDSIIGSILRSLLGYNDRPSVMEVAGYLVYWLVIVLGVRWWAYRLGARKQQQRA